MEESSAVAPSAPSTAAAVEVAASATNVAVAVVAVPASDHPQCALCQRYAAYELLVVALSVAYWALAVYALHAPTVVAGIFLGTLFPGLLLSLHVLMSSSSRVHVNRGLDDLSEAMGDKSCAPAAISAHWVTSHVANVVVWVLTTGFAIAWSVYAYVAGRVRSPIGVAFVAAALLFILFYRRAAHVGQRCKPTSRPCDATVQPADAEGVSMVAVATAAPEDAPDVAATAPATPPGHALQNRRFFVEPRIYSP